MSTVILEKNQSLSKAVAYLKASRPLRAEEVCRDYLLQHPGCTDHQRLLSQSLSKQNRLTEAEEQLRFALKLNPEYPQLHEDLGSVLGLQSRFEEAIPAFERAIQLQPALPLAHKKLGQALAAVGRGRDADEAFQVYIDKDQDRLDITQGVNEMREGKLDEAVHSLQTVLKRSPESVNAMRYLAVAYWQGKKKLDDAEALLRRATQRAPDYTGAWLILGALLLDTNKQMEAIDAYEQASKLEPDNAETWAGLGSALSMAMYPDKSAAAYEKSIALNPEMAAVQMGYAHTLKTLGRQAEALVAYRAAIRIKPDFGEVYWSMANLKIFNFENDEVQAMSRQLDKGGLTDSAEIHFNFALAKALEDTKDYDKAFHHYHIGNQQQRVLVKHEPLDMENRFNAVKKTFTKTFLEEHYNIGNEVGDPIFIIGLPRSGSTLLEQILASHSQVEGTSELPIMGKIAQSIGRYRTDGVQYPEALEGLRDRDLRAYGQQYIEESQRHRSTNKPFFTDKLPNNFPFVGLIHLILPKAKIINARRHPFDSCLGAYKQLFASGQNFTYDMFDLAHYYQQYDAMIKHWHEVLPGKILDVHYEETVTDLENQVRRILDHCDLPFEASCVKFHETERAVKTASSEQVRQPIYQGALGTWRRYEKHVDIWQKQLGYIVDELPLAAKNAGL